jgi:hypothetical protein
MSYSGDHDRVTDIGMFDQMPACFESGQQTIDLAGDLEGVLVVGESLELVSECWVELDPDTCTISGYIDSKQYGFD